MKNFNRGGGFGDRKSGGGNFNRRDSGARSFGRGGDSSSRPAMHKAVCAECGNSCEVPFKPTGDRPIFCSNCFKGKDGAETKRAGSRDFARPNFSDRKLFKATCAECGNSCEVPFQPASGKPVYCSQCFGKDEGRKNNAPTNNNDRGNENFEILSAKLDKILRALELVIPAKPVSRPEITKETPKPAAIKEIKNTEIKKIAKKIIKKAAVSKASAPKKAKKK